MGEWFRAEATIDTMGRVSVVALFGCRRCPEQSSARADARGLLERLDEASDRLVGGHSGGRKRRRGRVS